MSHQPIRDLLSHDIVETERLWLRPFEAKDTSFILELLSEPSFIQNIVDKGLQFENDALQYLKDVPWTQYQKFGYGLYAIEHKSNGKVLGMCGLVNRPELEYADLGYALLENETGKGYALEACIAIVDLARDELKMPYLEAVTKLNNCRSRALLEKLEFNYTRNIELYGETNAHYLRVL